MDLYCLLGLIKYSIIRDGNYIIIILVINFFKVDSEEMKSLC